MKIYTLKAPDRRRKALIDYARELNPEQYKVVTEADGPSLVLAGAGSGKTRTLIYRVAYLLEKDVRPENILLVTFTNKAAREMLDRVENLLGYKPNGLWGGTFHHIGNLILRRYAHRLGYSRDFGILDREDSRYLVDSCIHELGIDTNKRRFPKAGVLESIINLATNRKESIEEVVRSFYPYFEELIPGIERVASSYAEHKKSSNNMDYNDLLTKWIELLKKVPEARERYTKQFRYILVDEYQDTNRLQYEIIRILSSYHKNILVVGDDAQSIYSFRAADIKNILDFPKVFPGTRIFKLETNYRSTPEILNLANQSIKHNLNQYPKRLRSVQEGGHLPILAHLQDIRQQSAFVAQRILELRDEGIPMKEIAVLFRARYQAVELELELSKRGIPYVIRGGVRFFEQAHIKDVLAHLRLVVNPKDELSWKRALQLQPGVGRTYAHRIWEKIASYKNPVNKILTAKLKLELPPRAKGGWNSFLKTMRSISRPGISGRPSAMVREIVKTGYDKYVQTSFEDASDRLEDLEQLANFAHAYDSVKKFLTDITLREGFKGETIRGARDEDEYVVLTTIHQAKGLEWQVVMIVGLCHGQFPHPKSFGDSAQLEEERRLFYVAITRTKRELYLTHPIMRFDYSSGEIITRPSSFLQELPEHCYEEWRMEEEGFEEEELEYVREDGL